MATGRPIKKILLRTGLFLLGCLTGVFGYYGIGLYYVNQIESSHNEYPSAAVTHYPALDSLLNLPVTNLRTGATSTLGS